MKAWVLSLSLLSFAAAAAGPDVEIQTVQGVTVKRFYGYAFDAGSGRYLYTEVHRQRYSANGRWLGGTMDYFAPDGRELAHKTLDFSKSPFIPLYRLEDLNPRYDEGISKITADKVYLFKQTADDESPRRRTVERSPDLAADSGFDNYLVDHFDELMGRKTLEFTLAVPGKLDSYRFQARRIADTTFQGKPAVRFKIELASLLSWFVDPIVVTYDPHSRRLLEYRGVSNVLDPKTGEVFKSVKILYTDKPPPGAPAKLPPLG